MNYGHLLAPKGTRSGSGSPLTATPVKLLGLLLVHERTRWHSRYGTPSRRSTGNVRSVTVIFGRHITRFCPENVTDQLARTVDKPTIVSGSTTHSVSASHGWYERVCRSRRKSRIIEEQSGISSVHRMRHSRDNSMVSFPLHDYPICVSVLLLEYWYSQQLSHCVVYH